MNILIVIQARTGSTRLPGKVLLPCAGGTILGRMLERVTMSRLATDFVVATTEAAEDDEIVRVARRGDVDAIRGHATDLLDRHVQAARARSADVVIKIPSDCPLIDPAVIDRVIGVYLSWADRAPVDFVSNLHPPSWPDGYDVEVMSREALETAWREATRPLEREHTTPYLWDNPEKFIARNVTWETHRDVSQHYRLTLDHAEDYALIRGVFDELWSPLRVFSLAETLALLDARPELRATNAMHRGTTWYRNHPGELRTLANQSARRST